MSRIWRQFSQQRQHPTMGTQFTPVVEHERALRMYGISEADQVTVNLIEDADGEYRGFIDKTSPDRLIMVQHKRIFPMQFPYGVERIGEQGEVVPIRIEVAS